MSGSSPGTGNGPQTLDCNFNSGSSYSDKGIFIDLGASTPPPGAQFDIEWDMVVTGYGTHSGSHHATLLEVGGNYLLKALEWGATSCNDQQTHSYRLEARPDGKTVCDACIYR